MIKPLRLTRSRKHKNISDNGLETIYVGRPTKYGNPYRIIDTKNNGFNVVFVSGGLTLLVAWALPKNMAINLSIEKYRDGINLSSVDLIKRELKGKNLSCWCKENEICHADILLRIANE